MLVKVVVFHLLVMLLVTEKREAHVSPGIRTYKGQALMCTVGTFPDPNGHRCLLCHCIKNCRQNGHCTGECEAGWTGFKCQQRCSIGKYGHGCNRTCHCVNNKPCEGVTGICAKRVCRDGYWGTSCQFSETTYKELSFWLVCVAAIISVSVISGLLAYHYHKKKQQARRSLFALRSVLPHSSAHAYSVRSRTDRSLASLGTSGHSLPTIPPCPDDGKRLQFPIRLDRIPSSRVLVTPQMTQNRIQPLQ